MTYRIAGLSIEPFAPLFRLSTEELATRHIVRRVADSPVGFPCRVLLEDAKPGDSVLLLNHEYQSAPTPYRGRHAIYVNEGAREPRIFVDEVPPALRVRPAIALRAFDDLGMMIDAEIVTGATVQEGIFRQFSNPKAAYLQAHNAARGCFAARIDRT